MSAIAENLRRQRLPLLATVSVALMASLVWLGLVYPPSPPSSATSVAAPGVVQPAWDVIVSLEGRSGPLTKADKAAFNRSRPQVVALVEDLYDGLFLAPGTVDEVVARAFTRAAARSLESAALGLPANTTDVEIIRRSAEIGLQAQGSRHAAVDVTVVAKGETAGKPIKVSHSSTLWLERQGRSWKVIGFEVTQRPLK
ncbi:MAG: hypothetical protein M3238_00520 [Actinomycetota bacterium]|nr:hypothetical protein [Actinomycetota bacterium]